MPKIFEADAAAAFARLRYYAFFVMHYADISPMLLSAMRSAASAFADAAEPR